MQKKSPVAAAASRGAIWELLGELTRTAAGLLPLAMGPVLLSPQDFGVAMAALLVIATIDALSQTGFRQAILQAPDLQPSMVDTAWTLLLVRGAVLAGMCAITAPALAGFFPDAPPQLSSMIGVCAGVLLLTSAQGSGTFLLARKLAFRRLQWVNTVPAVLGAITTIGLLVMFRTPWAYVWGRLLAAVVETVLSYVVAPRRHRLMVDREACVSLVRFGRWIFVLGMVLFLMRTGDEPLVGRWLGLAAMGMYKLAFDLSQLPVDRVVRVIARVAMPAFARLQDDAEASGMLLAQAIRISGVLALPSSALVVVFAPDLVALLQPEYAQVAPLAQLLCVGVMARTITAVAGAYFQGIGRPELDVLSKAAHLLVLFVPLYAVAMNWQLTGVTVLATVAMMAPLLPCLLWLSRHSGLRISAALGALLPGLMSAVVIGVSAAGLRWILPPDLLGAILALSGTVGLVGVGLAVQIGRGRWDPRAAIRGLRPRPN